MERKQNRPLVDIAELNVNEAGITHREEREIFNRQWAQEKYVRRMDNVQHFTGYLRPGKYIYQGVGQRG